MNGQSWKRYDGGDDSEYDGDDDDDGDEDDNQNFQFSLKLGSREFGLVANGSVAYGFMLTFFIFLQY